MPALVSVILSADRIGRSLVIAASLAVALVGSVGTSAASPCATAIVDDWVDDAAIQGVYDVPCYREAIAALQDDMRNYSSAEEDIRRALQARLLAGGSGDSASGADGVPGADDGASGGTPGSSAKPQEQDGPADASGGEGAAGVAAGADELAAPSDAAFEEALGGSSSGSLPAAAVIALAVLGAAALAGAAWLVRRQLAGRGRPPG